MDNSVARHVATQTALAGVQLAPAGAQAATAGLHPVATATQATFPSQQTFKLYQTSVYYFQFMCRNRDDT
jgi:hypothetical protein